ncbi:MAG: zinc ribbon domain-containing protein [Candidatus Hodarchaeales archaeon]|jgi:transposase
MFQQFLTNKAPLYGSTVIEIDRWSPSSRLCSNCFYYHRDLKLADRIFPCPLCGLVLDRDQNATLNVTNYYYIYHSRIDPVTESSVETLNACEEVVKPVFQQARVIESGSQALPKTRDKMP